MVKKQNRLKNFLEKINKKINLNMLTWVMLIMSLLAILSYTVLFYKFNFIHFGFVNSIIGILSFILIRRKRKSGLALALIWSLLQIISIQFNSFALSLIQFFDLSVRFSLNSTSFVLIKIDFLAILLFYLFYQKRNEMRLLVKNGT